MPLIGKGVVPNSKYQDIVLRVWEMNRSVNTPVGGSLASCCRSWARLVVMVVLSCTPRQCEQEVSDRKCSSPESRRQSSRCPRYW